MKAPKGTKTTEISVKESSAKNKNMKAPKGTKTILMFQHELQRQLNKNMKAPKGTKTEVLLHSLICKLE